MSRSEEAYRSAMADTVLNGKKIPILTLDHKWHKLFTQTEPTKRIKRHEEELNELIKRRGKANTEIKEIQRLKKKLMQEIMENADSASSGNDLRAIKKTQENTRLLGECNEKIAAYEDELLALPREIDRVNKELTMETMEICYEKLRENEREIAEITKWAARVKEELKERLVQKQEKEQMNQELYSYMHDVFGMDVINLFDRQYKNQNQDKK